MIPKDKFKQINEWTKYKEKFELASTPSQDKVVCVGVTFARFVSLSHARPWLVHAYRNIKGRGLHTDEYGSSSLPLEQDEVETTRQEQAPEEPAGPIAATEEDRVDIAVGATKQPTTDRQEDTTTDKIETAKQTSATTQETTKDTAEPQSKGQDEGVSPKRRKLDTTDEQEDIETSKDGAVESMEVSQQEDIETNKDSAVESMEVSQTFKMSAQEIIKPLSDQTAISDSVSRCAESEDKMKASRAARKRKMPEDTEPVTEKTPPATSTYDRVRLIIQPWRKPEGGINKPIFKMMLESVMLFLMMNPGSDEETLFKRYRPYLQPMVLRNILNILVDIGCLTSHNLRRPVVTLFSEPNLQETEETDGDDVINYYLPSEECLYKLGQFGKEMFPKAKWPDSTVLHG